MRLEIKKYEHPIVWIDTNFVISMAKRSQPRAEQLLEFLENSRGRYFLVEGDDAELQMGNGDISKYAPLLSRLSSGVSFLPYELIEQFQFQSFARAAIRNQPNVDLITRDYLSEDPVGEYKSAQERGFVLDVRPQVRIMQVMNEVAKREIYQSLLQTRPVGRSVAEQQRLESETPSKIFKDLIAECTNRTKKNPNPTLDDYRKLMMDESSELATSFRYISDRLQWWKAAGGSYNPVDFYKFIDSDAFKLTPYNRINSILWGDIYAGGEKLKPSDYWDVKHMSAILPFCNIVFTEKRMRLRLATHRLDEEYNVEVYSMQNIEEFFQKHKES